MLLNSLAEKLRFLWLLALSGIPAEHQAQTFVPLVLDGTTSLENPTSLDFGPDGRLYVSQQFGLINSYDVSRSASGEYSVVGSEVITLVADISNHNDNGMPNTAVTGRQVTGIIAAGTALNPLLYVSNSDPRSFDGDSAILDTNSGMLSRLRWNGSSWEIVHLVRGLPRSANGHSANGLALDTATNTLYLAMGGHTNMGAPSTQFAGLPEYAYSAAVLSFDLDVILALPLQTDGTQSWYYDMHTLDDPDPGRNSGIAGLDLNDPFGGNYGRNQARITAGSPVQIYAAGFRNIFDLLFSSKNQLYTFDNGPNNGWGSIPVAEGPAGLCTNQFNDGGITLSDNFHLLSPGYYGGHPNPTRANAANTFAGQSPILTENPQECDYQLPGVDDASLFTLPASTNGLAEYTASTFAGDLQGEILAASFDGSIYSIDMGPAGNTYQSHSALLSGFCTSPLDVIAMGDSAPFPGTIWVACYGIKSILVFEPVDSVNCTGDTGFILDDDEDGFSNGDELANGTSPCNAGSFPPDFDGDKLSDLLDNDDDNDGISDLTDLFALDAANGSGSIPPKVLLFGNSGPEGGFFDMGFTGMMNNFSDYLDQFDPGNITAGGAASVFTVDAVSEGDAFGTGNDQEYAFHTGVDLTGSAGRLVISTKLLPPYFDGAIPPQNFQAFGMYFGPGNQSDYTKLVLSNSASGQLGIISEVGDIATQYKSSFPIPAGPLSLYLEINLTNNKVRAGWSADNGNAIVPVGNAFTVPSTWFDNVLAAGVIGTSNGPPPPFTATWDELKIEADTIEFACQNAPLNTAEVPLSATAIDFFWDPVPGARGYAFRGRQAGSGPFKKFITTDTMLSVTGLTPGVNYEWKVRADCTTVQGPDSALRGFNLP